MTWKGVAWALPWVIAAFFWVRGLWRGRKGDCVAGVFIAIAWAYWMLSLGLIWISDLGSGLVLSSPVTYAISLLPRETPEITKREMKMISLASLIVGCFLCVIL